MRLRELIWRFICVTFVVCTSGCDSASVRQPIRGTVYVDGEPVTRGSITLLPDAGHRGPAASTSITQGVYQFTTANGPTPGMHRVIVGVETPRAPRDPSGDQAGDSPVDSLAASSAVAKHGPAIGSQNNHVKEPDAASRLPTQWQAKMDVPPMDKIPSGQPFDLRFSATAVASDSESPTP